MSGFDNRVPLSWKNEHFCFDSHHFQPLEYRSPLLQRHGKVILAMGHQHGRSGILEKRQGRVLIVSVATALGFAQDQRKITGGVKCKPPGEDVRDCPMDYSGFESIRVGDRPGA